MQKCALVSSHTGHKHKNPAESHTDDSDSDDFSGRMLMLCDTVAGCVCAHTSCSPDLLSVSHLLHIHQSLTAATNSGLCRYVSVCLERTDIWPGWPWQKLVSGLAFVKRNLDQTPQTKGQRSREAATLTRTSYPPRNLLPSLSPRCVSSVMQKRVCGLYN